MSKDNRITTDEWLSEIARLEKEAGEDSEGWFGLYDIAERWGCHENVARKRLRTMVKEGRVECGRAKRKNIVGEWANVISYRIKHREKK